MDSVIGWLIGLSILVVAVTLCAAIGALSFRILGGSRGAGAGASADGQTALLAGSIALFGILITGIFLFTTLRIDEGAQRAASEAARERATEVAEEVVRELQDQISRLTAAVKQLTQRSIVLSAFEIQVGTPVMVEFFAEESRTLDFSAPTYGTYIIEVEGVTPDFDPLLYLYEDGTMIEDDDDSGAGSNSRVMVPLGAGVHTIRVEEAAGLPGICLISITFQSNRR